jgi:hypothetical protein
MPVNIDLEAKGKIEHSSSHHPADDSDPKGKQPIIGHSGHQQHDQHHPVEHRHDQIQSLEQQRHHERNTHKINFLFSERDTKLNQFLDSENKLLPSWKSIPTIPRWNRTAKSIWFQQHMGSEDGESESLKVWYQRLSMKPTWPFETLSNQFGP